MRNTRSNNRNVGQSRCFNEGPMPTSPTPRDRQKGLLISCRMTASIPALPDDIDVSWDTPIVSEDVSVDIEKARELRKSLQVSGPERTRRYGKYLKSNHWRTLRKHILSLAGGQCELACGKAAEHVHHMTYVRLGEELDTDLLAVCHKCHDSFHNNTRKNYYPDDLDRILLQREFRKSNPHIPDRGVMLLKKLHFLEKHPKKGKKRAAWMTSLMNTRDELRELGLIPSLEERRTLNRQLDADRRADSAARKRVWRERQHEKAVQLYQEKVIAMRPRRRPKAVQTASTEL